MKHRHGFTLLEMIVVLTIAALIIGVGAAAVARMTDEHALKKTSLAVERLFMTAVYRAATNSQIVAFDEQGVALSDTQTGGTGQSVAFPKGTRLSLRRMGSDKLVPAAGQRVLLRTGGLCEPLALQFEWQGAILRATLDPLTGGMVDVEEFFYR